MDGLNLEQHVISQTHNHGHILDVVITRNGQDTPSDLSLHPPVFSEHYPITFFIKSSVQIPVKENITYRKLKNIDINDFKNDILESDLVKNPKISVSDQVEQYNCILSKLLDKHAPRITKQVIRRKQALWFTPEMQKEKAKRRQKENVWIKNRCTVNVDILEGSKEKK